MYVINLDDKKVQEHIVTHCDSFGIEYIPQEVSNKIKGKSFPHNTFRIQSDDFIMCGFYCIARKTLLGYKNLLSLNEY